MSSYKPEAITENLLSSPRPVRFKLRLDLIMKQRYSGLRPEIWIILNHEFIYFCVYLLYKYKDMENCYLLFQNSMNLGNQMSKNKSHLYYVIISTYSCLWECPTPTTFTVRPMRI